MLVVAAFLIAKGDGILSILPVTCFAVTIAVGQFLWSRRDRINPFLAIQLLCSVLAILVPLVWFTTEYWGSPAALAAMHFPRSQWWIVLIVPVGMLWALAMERLQNWETKRGQSQK